MRRLNTCTRWILRPARSLLSICRAKIELRSVRVVAAITKQRRLWIFQTEACGDNDDTSCPRDFRFYEVFFSFLNSSDEILGAKFLWNFLECVSILTLLTGQAFSFSPRSLLILQDTVLFDSKSWLYNIGTCHIKQLTWYLWIDISTATDELASLCGGRNRRSDCWSSLLVPVCYGFTKNINTSTDHQRTISSWHNRHHNWTLPIWMLLLLACLKAGKLTAITNKLSPTSWLDFLAFLWLESNNSFKTFKIESNSFRAFKAVLTSTPLWCLQSISTRLTIFRKMADDLLFAVSGISTPRWRTPSSIKQPKHWLHCAASIHLLILLPQSIRPFRDSQLLLRSCRSWPVHFSILVCWVYLIFDLAIQCQRILTALDEPFPAGSTARALRLILRQAIGLPALWGIKGGLVGPDFQGHNGVTGLAKILAREQGVWEGSLVMML